MSTSLKSSDAQHQAWAILCNPSRYDVERAAEVLEEDTWNTPVGTANPGDKLIFWKTKAGGPKKPRNRGRR
jgi:hypothetical protein